MNVFDYARAVDLAHAVNEMARPGSRAIGGGTNLVDLVKAGVERPARLVDLTRLPLAAIEPLPGGGLRLGALATNTDVAVHEAVEARWPVLSRAILAGASPQLRNMATVGGNLFQRTRCPYFYDAAVPCNKRAPGSGCPAIPGLNRVHAILGASDACVAVHPSDMCVALAALEAVVRVTGPSGEREVPFAELHRLPGGEPERDHTLLPGEVVTAVDLPPEGFAAHSAYLKVRDRASFSFALVSVAAALSLEGGAIAEARLAFGGVAHKPWRSREAEALLRGEAPSREVFRRAAERALEGARPLAHNGFKVELATRAAVRALSFAANGGGRS